MKFIIITLVFIVFIASCSDRESDDFTSSCYEFQEGTINIYKIFDASGNQIGTEVHTFGALASYENGDSKIEAHKVIVERDGLAIFNYYIAQRDGEITFLSSQGVKPLFEVKDFAKAPLFKFNLCKNKDFSLMEAPEEEVIVISNGIPVNGKFKYEYSLDFKFLGSSMGTNSEKDLTLSRYRVSLKYQEAIVEPAEITYSDGTRVRNQSTQEMEIVYSRKKGIVKFDYGDIIKILEQSE